MFQVVRSCMFHPCDWFSHCQVLHVPPLRLVLALSGPACSTPVIGSRIVRSRVFHPCYSFLDCQARVFHLCYSFPGYQVLHVPPLRLVLALSGLAFSTPAIRSRVVRSCVFHLCHSFIRSQIDPAFLTTAIIKVSSCQVPRFQLSQGGRAVQWASKLGSPEVDSLSE